MCSSCPSPSDGKEKSSLAHDWDMMRNTEKRTDERRTCRKSLTAKEKTTAAAAAAAAAYRHHCLPTTFLYPCHPQGLSCKYRTRYDWGSRGRIRAASFRGGPWRTLCLVSFALER